MVDRVEPVGPVQRACRLCNWTGAVATALVLFLTFGTLIAVGLGAESGARLAAADWAAVRFTVTQALLSAAISVLLAVPLARALFRRQFPGRRGLITLLGAPFILPVIVAILGLLAVFGRNGIVSQVLIWAGLEPISIYGFHGVVFAHVFFNLPLATRLILQGWLAIPAERFRLAASLNFGPSAQFRIIEWPMLRAMLPGAFLVIFLICTTSFAVALTLGGGPRATTVELAIYQAFRFDFDLGKAALLGLSQFTIGAVAAILVFAVSRGQDSRPGLDRSPQIWGANSLWLRLLDGAWIVMIALFLLTPLVTLILRGAPNVWDLPPSVFHALARSLVVALASTALTVTLSLSMALWIARGRHSAWVEGVGYLAIAASPLVIGTGLFIMLFPVLNPVAVALPLTAIVNAIMALPFALRAIVPAVGQVERDYRRLIDSLGFTDWASFRVVVLPRIRRPIGFAAGLAAALSMGDLGVIALFGDPNAATLPMQMFQLMGSYQMDAASGAALLLLGASLALFRLFDRGGRIDVDL